MSDILEPYMSNSNPTLEHHGILGMHWGYRKDKTSSISKSKKKNYPSKKYYKSSYKSSSEKNKAIIGHAAATILGTVALESIENTAFHALGNYGHYKAAVVVAEVGHMLIPELTLVGAASTLATTLKPVKRNGKSK